MIGPFLNPRFESERLRMRPQTIADAPALFEAYSDVELMTWWSSAPHQAVEDTVAYLTPEAGERPWRGWLMERRDTGEVVGTLASHDHRRGVAEIGYLLIRRHWGAGLAREGVARLVSLLFEDEGYRRVVADTDPENRRSNRLLRSMGFTLEGRLRGEWETHIGVRDSYIWGLLRHEWRAGPLARGAAGR